MSVQRFMPIHAVEVEIFHWIHDNFDLLVGLKEKSGSHQGRDVSPLGKHLGVTTWLSRHFSKTQTFIQCVLSCLQTPDKLFYLYEGGFVFTRAHHCSVDLSGNMYGFSPNLDKGWALNFGVDSDEMTDPGIFFNIVRQGNFLEGTFSELCLVENNQAYLGECV